MTLDLPKILDTAIKAPLWFFFALSIGFGAISAFPTVLFSIEDLAATKSLIGPPALWFVISASLFASSAVARIWHPTARIAHRIYRATITRISAHMLSDEERALVHLFEAEAAESLTFVDEDPAVTALRDKGYLHATLIGKSRQWGIYRLPVHLEMMRRSNPKSFRSIFKAQDRSITLARQNMTIGMRRAGRLVA